MNERKEQHPPDSTPGDDARGKVIRVDFSHRRRAEDAVVRAPDEGLASPPPDPDTVARTFTRAEVAELFGIAARRLAAWERKGIICPTISDGPIAVYTFPDLLAVRVAKGLVSAGFPMAQIRRTIEALKAKAPDLAQPLTDARVRSEGARLVAQQDGTRFDPITGQLVLDFDVRALREDVVRVLRPRLSKRRQEAYELYLEGLRLDEDETTAALAEAAYRKALELDPTLATAMTNLGNLRLLADDRAEAESLYRRAMAADAAQAEAPYNLAYILVERGEHTDAIELFERAIELKPDFAEGHFNLAVALTEVGQRDRARKHWRRYLDLDPRGPWSALARQHMENG